MPDLLTEILVYFEQCIFHLGYKHVFYHYSNSGKPEVSIFAYTRSPTYICIILYRWFNINFFPRSFFFQFYAYTTLRSAPFLLELVHRLISILPVEFFFAMSDFIVLIESFQCRYNKGLKHRKTYARKMCAHMRQISMQSCRNQKSSLKKYRLCENRYLNIISFSNMISISYRPQCWQVTL